MAKNIITEIGAERLCIKCEEYWPATPEYFNKRGDGFHSYCKAFVYERGKELREGATRIVKRRTKREMVKVARLSLAKTIFCILAT